MPEAAVHLASGKVRELYALDEERLLLVASDRISVFDLGSYTRNTGIVFERLRALRQEHVHA